MNFFKFLIKNNIWIALIAVSNVIYFQLLFSGNIELTYILIVFFGTLFIYNLHRYLKKSNTIKIIELINQNRNILLFIFLFILFVSFDFISFDLIDISKYSPVIFIIFSLCCIATIIYLLSSRMELPWKKFPIVKPLSLAFIWFLLVAIIPLIHHAGILQHWGKLTHFFLVLQAVCLIFDIKDLDKDRAGGINTIANTYGVTRTKQIALILLIISIVVVFFISSGWAYQAGLISISVITMYAIRQINTDCTENYYYLWMDGLLGLFLPLAFLY